MKSKNLLSTDAFDKLLSDERVDLTKALNEQRVKDYDVAVNDKLSFSYAAMPVNDTIIDHLQELTQEMNVIDRYEKLLDGHTVNTGESRKVLHQLTRGNVLESKNVKDLEDFYNEQTKRIFEFAQNVRDKKILGSTKKTFTTFVQIGIGGSDLGPKAMYLALKNEYDGLDAHFISNVDPDDANEIFNKIDCERTLFILVSKSGTTLETLTNLNFIYKLIKSKKISKLDPKKHVVAVTSNTSPLANNSEILDSFFINDFIGGRYSSTSAVGTTILSLCFGPDVVKKFLKGAASVDKAAYEPDIRKNAQLLDAAMGVYLRNVLDYPTTAIIPYSQALSRFPAHLQQLDMESNGKSVNIGGDILDYATGPVVFGECGTNSQHSFFQLLHQGTDVIPLQFIGFSKSQAGKDIVINHTSSQDKLVANLIAQIVGLAQGKDSSSANKVFLGDRPSSLLYAKKLDAYVLGSLLAFYENKIVFQGFLWNINSFDQEGVQLGKKLANEILDGDSTNPILNAYLEKFDN